MRSVDWLTQWPIGRERCRRARKLIRRTESQMADATRYLVQHFNQLDFTAFKEPMAYEEELKAGLAADQRGELTIHTATHIVRSSPLGEDAVTYSGNNADSHNPDTTLLLKPEELNETASEIDRRQTR